MVTAGAVILGGNPKSLPTGSPMYKSSTDMCVAGRRTGVAVVAAPVVAGIGTVNGPAPLAPPANQTAT